MEKQECFTATGNSASVMPSTPSRPNFQSCRPFPPKKPSQGIEDLPISTWRKKRTRNKCARGIRFQESLARDVTTASKMVSPKKLADHLHKAIKMEQTTTSEFGAPQGQNHNNSSQDQLENDLSSTLQHIKFKSETSEHDFVKFRDLAMIPRPHALLLQRACVDHPDLAICSDRTSRWHQFAYETLGELLFFMSSTRQREMTEEACKHLKRLWKDAQDLGFDLSWLTPSVNSGLNSGSCLKLMEALSTLEKRKIHLEETRDTLRCQMSTMMMQLCEAEQELADLEKPIQQAKTDIEFTQKSFLYKFS